MVVGKRSTYPAYIYSFAIILILIVGFLGSIIPGPEGEVAKWGSILMLVVDIIMLYLYFNTPEDAILIVDHQYVSIPGQDVYIHFDEIEEMRSVRENSRGVNVSWGRVFIHTAEKKYTVRYIEYPEGAVQQIAEEMSSYRMGKNFPE